MFLWQPGRPYMTCSGPSVSDVISCSLPGISLPQPDSSLHSFPRTFALAVPIWTILAWAIPVVQSSLSHFYSRVTFSKTIHWNLKSLLAPPVLMFTALS